MCILPYTKKYVNQYTLILRFRTYLASFFQKFLDKTRVCGYNCKKGYDKEDLALESAESKRLVRAYDKDAEVYDF